MRALKGILFSIACLVLVPAAAYAQASIAGVVRDTSGAVLPGVTVEAASPALIERVRSVVTDGTGQYKVVDLRPGTYSVTFTLPGFSTLKREGIELAGSFTATVNADLRVGARGGDGDGDRGYADRRRPERDATAGPGKGSPRCDSRREEPREFRESDSRDDRGAGLRGHKQPQPEHALGPWQPHG